MDDRNLILGVLGMMILLVSTGAVFAFGVSTPYWDEHPLEMYPGQTREIPFNLQNCPSLADYCEVGNVHVVAEFEEGGEIASIISGEDYFIPYGTADTNLILKVTIPETASVGDSYNVRFSLGSPSADEGGNIQLGVKYNVDFPVNVVPESDVPEPIGGAEPPIIEEPSSAGAVWLWILIIIVVIALIIWWVSAKSKK